MKKYKKRKPLGEFKSKLEVEVWSQLTKKYGKKGSYSYETDRFPYTLRRNYVPDYTCVLPNGRVFYIEAKGYLRPEDRTKMIAVKQDNPNIDLRLLFSKDNKLNGKSNTRYSEWATKHGFPYAIGFVPREWFKQ